MFLFHFTSQLLSVFFCFSFNCLINWFIVLRLNELKMEVVQGKQLIWQGDWRVRWRTWTRRTARSHRNVLGNVWNTGVKMSNSPYSQEASVTWPHPQEQTAQSTAPAWMREKRGEHKRKRGEERERLHTEEHSSRDLFSGLHLCPCGHTWHRQDLTAVMLTAVLLDSSCLVFFAFSVRNVLCLYC